MEASPECSDVNVLWRIGGTAIGYTALHGHCIVFFAVYHTTDFLCLACLSHHCCFPASSIVELWTVSLRHYSSIFSELLEDTFMASISIVSHSFYSKVYIPCCRVEKMVLSLFWRLEDSHAENLGMIRILESSFLSLPVWPLSCPKSCSIFYLSRFLCAMLSLACLLFQFHLWISFLCSLYPKLQWRYLIQPELWPIHATKCFLKVIFIAFLISSWSANSRGGERQQLLDWLYPFLYKSAFRCVVSLLPPSSSITLLLVTREEELWSYFLLLPGWSRICFFPKFLLPSHLPIFLWFVNNWSLGSLVALSKSSGELTMQASWPTTWTSLGLLAKNLLLRAACFVSIHSFCSATYWNTKGPHFPSLCFIIFLHAQQEYVPT